MRINNIQIIEENNEWDFKKEIEQAIQGRSVIDIKFSTLPKIAPSGFQGSYTEGVAYYAMILFE